MPLPPASSWPVQASSICRPAWVKEPVAGTPDTWTVREYYYNNQWQNLEVRKDAGKARAGSPSAEPDLATTLNEQYVWSARYVDAPVLRDRDTGTDGTLDETLYYTTDGNSNITALVGTDGAVVERYVYDSYGKVTFLTGAWVKTQIGQETAGTLSAYATEVLYCGYRFDSESGLYHVRHRVYHVTLGRWMQRDPQGYVDGMSLYTYVGGNPLSGVDPLGLFEPDKTVELLKRFDPEAHQFALREGVKLASFEKAVFVWEQTMLDIKTWRAPGTTFEEDVTRKLGGTFNPKDNTVYISQEVNKEDKDAAATMRHELSHAQDSAKLKAQLKEIETKLTKATDPQERKAIQDQRVSAIEQFTGNKLKREAEAKTQQLRFEDKTNGIKRTEEAYSKYREECLRGLKDSEYYDSPTRDLKETRFTGIKPVPWEPKGKPPSKPAGEEPKEGGSLRASNRMKPESLFSR